MRMYSAETLGKDEVRLNSDHMVPISKSGSTTSPTDTFMAGTAVHGVSWCTF